MPGAVVGNATRIWELNVHWALHAQCGIWDPRGRGVDIWECIRDHHSTPGSQVSIFLISLPSSFTDTTSLSASQPNILALHRSEIIIFYMHNRPVSSFLLHNRRKPPRSSTHIHTIVHPIHQMLKSVTDTQNLTITNGYAFICLVNAPMRVLYSCVFTRFTHRALPQPGEVEAAIAAPSHLAHHNPRLCFQCLFGDLTPSGSWAKRPCAIFLTTTHDHRYLNSYAFFCISPIPYLPSQYIHDYSRLFPVLVFIRHWYTCTSLMCFYLRHSSKLNSADDITGPYVDVEWTDDTPVPAHAASA